MPQPNLFNQLCLTIEAVGVEKTLALLTEAYKNTKATPEKDRLVTKISKEVQKIDPEKALEKLTPLLLVVVSTIGIEKTDAVLKNAQYHEIKFDNKDVEFVVTHVAKQFEIPVHEIIYGNGRKNDRKYAIGFTIFYLKEYYKYNMEGDIQYFMNKHLTLCHKYSKLIAKLNDRHISDRKYIEYKNLFDNLFINNSNN